MGSELEGASVMNNESLALGLCPAILLLEILGYVALAALGLGLAWRGAAV